MAEDHSNMQDLLGRISEAHSSKTPISMEIDNEQCEYMSNVLKNKSQEDIPCKNTSFSELRDNILRTIYTTQEKSEEMDTETEDNFPDAITLLRDAYTEEFVYPSDEEAFFTNTNEKNETTSKTIEKSREIVKHAEDIRKYFAKYERVDRFSLFYSDKLNTKSKETISSQPEISSQISKPLENKNFLPVEASTYVESKNSSYLEINPSSSGNALKFPQSVSEVLFDVGVNDVPNTMSSVSHEEITEIQAQNFETQSQCSVQKKAVETAPDAGSSLEPSPFAQVSWNCPSKDKLKQILRSINYLGEPIKEEFCDKYSQYNADKILHCDNSLQTSTATLHVPETKRVRTQSFEEDANLKRIKLSATEHAETSDPRTTFPQTSFSCEASTSSLYFIQSQMNSLFVEESRSKSSSPVIMFESHHYLPSQNQLSQQILDSDPIGIRIGHSFNSELGANATRNMPVPSCSDMFVIQDGEEKLPARPSSKEERNIIDQYLNVSDAASITPESPCSPFNVIPGLRSVENRNSAPPCSSFDARKGNDDCLSRCRYENVGRSFITSEFSTYVLQWNPSWFETQREKGILAPICKSYPAVKYLYANEQDYYNTYVCFLLTEIWLKMENARHNSPIIRVNFLNQADQTLYMKISCYVVLRDNDLAAGLYPKRGDIVLCKVLDAFENTTEFFGEVKSVGYPERHTEVKYQIRFDIFCVESLISPNGNTFDMQILYNIRLAELQNNALRSMSDAVKHLVMDPSSEVLRLDVVRYLPDKPLKKTRDVILNSISNVGRRAVLVDTTSKECNDVSLMSHVAYTLTKTTNSLVLVFLKNQDTFLDLCSRLLQFDLVIAVRPKEVRLNNRLLQVTLDSRLKQGERVADIYRIRPITLCLYSAPSLRECRFEFAQKETVCLLGEADLCTEVETALPLMYGAKKLILFGRPDSHAYVHPNLKAFGYHVTLLNRFYRYADR